MLEVPRFALVDHRLLFVHEFEHSAHQRLEEYLLDELHFLFRCLLHLLHTLGFLWVRLCVFVVGDQILLVSF